MSSSKSPVLRPTRIFSLGELGGTAEIATDEWGIAHIRASNRDDLFFAQGFNAARERLWQIDLWRKRGLGLLAEDFGPGFLAQDHAARHYLYRGDMTAEWAAYAPDAREISQAFVAGINAYVDGVLDGRMALPREFELFATKPAHWQAEDVVRIRTHCLARNSVSEVVRAHVLSTAGARAEALRKHLEPPVTPTTAPDLDLGGIPLALLNVYRLAIAAPTFSPERLAATMDDAWKWRVINSIGDVTQAVESEGSNNWAISGARTDTGRPIMALDPHRVHAVPALRYFVHLTMPGLDVIGAGDPAAPGIIMGHGDHAAFSVTIFGADQEDVYVYDLDPEDANAYRYGDGWETMTRIEETFRIKGHDPVTLPIRFARHGAVIHHDAERRRAYAIRTVWSEPGSAPYMASLSVMRARSHAEYRDALKGWGAPSINHLYADVEGTIAWQSVGKSPIRPNWEGLLPVPGDGRYEWQGFIPPEEMPSCINPEEGYFATANEMNLSQEWRRENPAIGHEWIDGSRAERIREVMQRSRHSFEQSCALQADLKSMPAERMQAILSQMRLEGLGARAAGHLLDWDCMLEADSSQAALFEVWISTHLTGALYDRVAVGGKVPPALQVRDIQSVLDAMERPVHWFGDEAPEVRRTLVQDSLEAAWRDLEMRFGADPAEWRWGRIHVLALKHLASGAFPQEARTFDIDPIELGGSGSTVGCAVYRPDDFAVTIGPSVRMVLDVGAWDNSVFINLPGQSGDPDSPHYRDLAKTWSSFAYKPLVFSREAVDRATVSIILLEPSGSK